MAGDRIDKLYNALKADGTSVPSRDIFRRNMLAPGKTGYNNRLQFFKAMKADGADVGNTYEDFAKSLGLHAVGTPTVNKYRQQLFNSVDPNKSRASELTHRAVNTAHKAMDNVRKPVRGAVVNKQGKKVDEFDVTPAKTLDDLNREYAQEVASDWEKKQQRQSLYNTTRSLDEVQRKIAERDAQLDEADNGFWTGIRHAAQGMNVTGGMFQQYDDDMRKELIDPKYKQYLVEANYLTQMKKQLIQEEEDAAAPNATKWDRFKHASSSFTSGMVDEAFGSDAFDFGGYNKMRESDVLLRINDRINRGVATDDDRRLLQILKDKEEVESRLDNDAYSFGRGASQTAGFVTDFLITGGGDFGGLGRLGGKMALGLARKTFAKTMTKDLGKRFAAWSLKNLGKTLGEATGAAMTATSVQIGKTAGNATQRYLGLDSDDGGLEYDKDGNLKFKGGTDAGTAIAKAIASGTIENYTELLGPHITSMGKRLFGWAGVGLEKITPDALSKFFDKVGSSELFKRIGTFTDEVANSKVLNAGKNALAKVGVNDMPEEGLEEEAGIILNSLITGDNKFSDLLDKETQYKTWGGVMSMIGAMRAIPIAKAAVGGTYSATKNKVEYFRCKHDLTKAETLARQALGDKWQPIKELIDNADNNHIMEVGINIIRQSDKYSQEQAKAAQNYIGQLLKMRGFNNATMASIRDKNAKGEGQTDADKKDVEVSNAYAEGHEAEGELRHQIQLEYEKRTANLAKRLGLTPEKIEAMNDNSFSSYIGLNSDADFDIFQYKKAKAAYDGVMDNAQNLVDIAGEVAAHRVDNMTNVHDGTIKKAFKKGTESNPDSPVYIISGNIELNDDGSINYNDSDKMIVVYDEETGQREAIGNFMLASVDPNMQDAEEVKAQAIQEAKQKVITEQSNVIDGVLVEGSEFTMESNDGSTHNYKIVQVDEQGNCIVSVDGTILPEPLSLDAIQQQYDQSNVARSVKNDQTTQEPEQTAQETKQTQQESQPVADKFDYDKITNENDGKVKSVVVTDEEGKNRFPNAKAVFLIQDKGAKPKFVVMDEEGNLTSYIGKRGDKIQLSGEMTVSEYKKQRQEELQKIAAKNANSSMIEDNSGTIEADRGEIEVEDNAQPLSETDADNVIAQMESSAEVAPDLELTPDNWAAEFGEDGIVSTPIGDVKMGENQVAKLFEKGRSKEFGMIKPTLTNPDVIIEVPSHSADGNEERSSSYLFIKTFLGKNGEKVYYFKSVTIKKDGLEISISSHYDRAKRVKEALMKGKLLYRKNDGAQTEQNQPSTSVTTSQEDAAGSSESKDTNISANVNENNESLTFEDGTPIPVDENGETDLSQTDATHAAEWYDNNLGEDADGWLDGEIKKAKKVLEQAKNRKLTGTKPSELVASKKEKEAAIADAQAHYDSAISIRDALTERRIAKEENTPEGRKNLIDKARRKFARLKSAVNNDAEAVAQLYKETVGSLLHRLYDGTGIDVTDTVPLTAEEYVASNLGAHSLNYEGNETSKGVKQETGLSREDFAKTQLLAADGKGTTIDALVHSLWDNRPSNLDSLDTQDIRNALIDVLTSGFKASEARSFIENIRIAQAEKLLEEQERAQENAAYAEQQKAESEAKSEEKLDNESDNESNDLDNETDNEKINDNINAPEVPEDATEEKPLGEQRTDSPFSARKNGKQQTEAERAADVEKNKVDDIGLVDAVVGKKIRKSFERIAKMMGAKIQYQRTDKLGNGWIQETTDADGNVHRTIFITLDSSITEGAQFIFGHEMTHQIKNLNPAAYNELTQLVLDTYGSDAFDKAVDETMQRYSDAGFSGRERDYYAEEVVADAVGEMIRDLNLAHTLALKMSHPLLAAIHEILQKIKLAFYGTEYSDVTKNIIRSIEKAYVKTANGQVTNSETGEDVSFSLRLKSAIEETETNPSDAQKESGNYKKGHIKFGGYDYTIENPKGSTRSGKDANGKEWKVTMHDTYGYIRGKYGKDGDHLDMFINDKADLDNWNGDVFVVDQVNPDGSFDEHKVMYGYDSMSDAEKAYLANYSEGWLGLGGITGASKAEFDKWLDTSNRKLKPFADYAKVKFSQAQSVEEPHFSLDDIKPVGVGAFGNIYNQFRGNAKAAIEFLKKVRGGEAVGALHHKDIGDIDLVWGKEGTGHSDGYGLSKLVKYHPEVLDNLQEILNDMRVVSSSKNRVNLESETHKAGVRLTWDGERKSWLLTAFKKETSASDKRTDTDATSLEGDTALSQTEGSAAKIDNSSETSKENGEKFSLKDEKIKSVAEKFGVNEDDVAMYANAVEKGSTAEAARARANIKRYLLQANEDKISSFKDIIKYTKPINEALKENFGDLDAMIEERRKQVEAQRNAMEAARKRAQEEEEKRQKHLDELSLIPTDELDKRYMDAIDNNDESTAREMLDESARRNGYGDVDSDYQGQGAWAAPSNPQYESDEARRADIENSPDVNLEDIALGYNLQPDDYFDNPRAYMNNTAYGLESAHVIKNALDAIKNGEKDVKVKVYRAVPTSVKEGKLRNGDWVTPSKKYAEMHGDNRLDGKYRIIEDEVPASQLWWDGNDANEFGFDDGKEYRYKNAKNNRKLNDLITYDNKGNVIPPSKRFNSRKNDIRFSLAGERGAAAADKAEERTIRMDNLSVAKDMEKNKKKAKAIKAATGWERGADGKWRYEMPDVILRDPKEWVNKKTLTLSDIVEKPNDLFKEYPELFDAYPELKDVKIQKGRAKMGGSYYDNTITLNLGYIREAIKSGWDTYYKTSTRLLKMSLVHEIQHYIQEKEGFAQGGNSEMIVDKNALDAIEKLRAEKEAVAKEFYAMSPDEQQRRKYEINNRYNDLTKQIERLEKSSRIGYDGYKRLSGEVEARNVSARLNMTPEERRKSLAEYTEDVARKDQIFLGVGDVTFSLRDMADGKESGAADMAEDLKSLNTPDEVDDAIKTAIEDMPSGWKMANKKMIHVAQALGENRKAEIAGEEPKFSLKDGTLIKAGTYFSGGGLVEEGLKGIIDPVVAVEYDEKISGVYRNNFGQHIVTADVRDVDPKELVKQIDGEVEYFHASPVCKNYSQAKSNHAEVELDKETAASTADFINAVKPKVVTIENVKGYKDSDAMKTITDALDANGYTWDADVYNAADYGGYTNRERLIVRAVRDGKLPEKPKKMAHKSGWYEAVADIIPTLTEKKNGVAPWMDVRLKADGIDWRNIDKPLYVMGSAYADGKIPHAFADELLPTLRTKSGDVIVMPDGKVYRAMGRVLARVSGVSDDYKMPFSESLSHTIIGNGIPTQLTEHVIAPLVQNTLRPTSPEEGNTKFAIRQFGTDIADASDKIKNLMNNEKIISRRIGSRAQAQSRVLETISRASDEFRRSNRASAKSGQDTWEKDRALGYVIRASYGTGSFLTEEEIKEITSGKVGNGQENQVYLSKDGKTVIKLNNLLMVDREFRFNEFLDRIKAHNEFTPDDMYTPLGFALNEDGDFCLVLEQPYVKGEPATQEEIDDYMESHGYDLYPVRVSADEVGAGWSNGEFEIWDTKPRNVLKDKNGDLHFIDTVIQHAFIDGHNDKLRLSLRGSTPYDKQMEEWKEKNHLEKGAVPMEKPVMEEGENIFDYANRMVEWTRNQNLWKTAPKQTGFQDALDKWKADNGLSPDAYPPVRPHRENYLTEIGYTEDLEEYNKKKELWKSAPKPKDFDLSVDLEDMNKQLRNIRRAVLNQKNYDQRTVKAVSDLVRKMLNIGWGDGLSRGKVGNLLSAAKNATGANDVKKYLDKAMGILAENYLNRLSTAYDNLINTKGARADQSGVIKMGSLDANGQAFMSEYKKAINMNDSSLNTYIANIEEDSVKNEDNVEMNDYRLAGIQAAIMFKQQIGGNDADIAELQRQIGELKNKKDATKEDKDLLKSLEKKLFENKFDRITMYENLLNNIQRMVKESKGRAREFREEIAEHKNEILHRANLDLEGVDSTYYDTTTAKKKFVNNDLQRAVFSSTYTFEQFLKFFGKKAANGEGYLYNYFTKLNQDALDEEQLYNEMNRNALDEKTKELFGKKKFMKLVGIDGNGMKEMDIEVTDYSNKKTGKRTIHLKQGQMLYIYLVNKETDGEMKLRAMGITEEDVAAIEANLDPRVKAMGEWLQDEYLPECQRRYQATHTKYFGAPMKEVENYFPLAINNRARNIKEDVNQDSDAMSQLAGTSTGAIVTRRVNVIPLDIENADAFEVAFNHLQEMEEWSAMLPFRQDVNTLLSYTHFRNQVQNMSSVAYGSGKTLWDEFKQTAQIAAGTYKPKVNAGMMDSRIAAAMGGIAVAKISGRLWTAIKQSQSATVFLPECDFTRFVKNGVNPYGSWKWAMENIPDFRKRVENMTYGDVKLRQYLDELEKLHDWTKTISKIGMAPNILVDGITCAVGARSVYETEVNRLTKLGYPKEKAEEKAYYKAVAAYNKTQQSSGGMYLSPMQVDRTYASAALSLFKNANYAYGRMQIEACRGLARTYDFWGGKHKTALIESMTRQIMEEDGLDENTARAIAKATYNRTFRQSIGRLINFATLVPVSWALYKVLPYLLTGDDDDKKKDMIEEAVLKGFATSLSDNYVIPFASNILNAGLKVEDGKPTFDPEVFRYQNLYINPATSDLANIYSMIGNQKWYSVCNKVGMLGVQMLIGFNPETVGALYQAFAEADSDNGNTAKEWQIGILKAISAPEESIRELYMDELGLKSGDIKKIPLAELEKRYAERQINRDNLLSQIFMDAESFNGYVDKYQKSFEKKIKDKMDKWDEYDKKKADEFFDTTSDPKLKDMIAKKRANDANAAADEQIAKEGLNQEKKGKEPSEEAYDAVKMSIDVAEDNAISTYNKVLNKRYAALNDEYNNQTDAMKFVFMSKHPNFKAYKDLESEYTTYGKKMKELKEKLVSADGYDAKQTILKQIRAEREKFSELQSKVR